MVQGNGHEAKKVISFNRIVSSNKRATVASRVSNKAVAPTRRERRRIAELEGSLALSLGKTLDIGAVVALSVRLEIERRLALAQEWEDAAGITAAQKAMAELDAECKSFLRDVLAVAEPTGG